MLSYDLSSNLLGMTRKNLVAPSRIKLLNTWLQDIKVELQQSVQLAQSKAASTPVSTILFKCGIGKEITSAPNIPAKLHF